MSVPVPLVDAAPVATTGREHPDAERGRRLKILMVALNFHPERTGSGVYNADLAFWLAERGHRVEVVTAPPHYPHWQRQAGYHYHRWTHEHIRGVDVYRCPVVLPRSPRGLRRVGFVVSFALSCMPVVLFRARSLRPDLVFTVEPTMLSLPVGTAACRMSGARLWHHVDDIELIAAELVDGFRWITRTVHPWYRRMLDRVDMVSTITETMREQLEAIGVPSERCRLVPRWIDTAGFDRSRGMQLRERLGIAPDERLVLYAGAMSGKQGVEQLVPLVERVDAERVRFVFCGGGPKRRMLEERLRSDGRVLLLNTLPPEKYRALMAAADVHLLLQRNDSTMFCMPSKLSSMLPTRGVIVAQAAPSSELGRLLAGIAVVVPPGDVDALVAAVSDAITQGSPFATSSEARGRLLADWSREEVLQGIEQEMFCMVNAAVPTLRPTG